MSRNHKFKTSTMGFAEFYTMEETATVIRTMGFLYHAFGVDKIRNVFCQVIDSTNEIWISNNSWPFIIIIKNDENPDIDQYFIMYSNTDQAPSISDIIKYMEVPLSSFTWELVMAYKKMTRYEHMGRSILDDFNIAF